MNWPGRQHNKLQTLTHEYCAYFGTNNNALRFVEASLRDVSSWDKIRAELNKIISQPFLFVAFPLCETKQVKSYSNVTQIVMGHHGRWPTQRALTRLLGFIILRETLNK